MMNPEIYGAIISAFLFGLSSSFHCITMCGPLIATAYSYQNSKTSLYLYQLGRLTSYMLLGGILGILGKGANALGELKEIEGISTMLSLILLMFVRLSLIFKGKILKFTPSFSKFLSPVFSYLKNKNQIWALGLSLGLLSAFLPCGVLYPAYALAFATGSVFLGSLVMCSFFLGTFPGLFAFSLGLGWLRTCIQTKFVSLLGVLLISLSLFFLVRRIFHAFHSENCIHSRPSRE